MIRSLSKDVTSVLKAQTNVPGYGDCVREVIQNSIDAGATQIKVELDCQRLGFVVSDNGQGISPKNMNNVARRSHTSKCSSLEDLGHVKTFGFRGEALASIAAQALLTVTSRRVGYSETYSIRVRNGRRISRFRSHDSLDTPSGTIVAVSDLYGNTPVRKRLAKASLAGVKHELWSSLLSSDVGVQIFENGEVTFSIGRRVGVEPRVVQVARSMGVDIGRYTRVDEQIDGVKLHGLVGGSSVAVRCQHILVNSRPVVPARLCINDSIRSLVRGCNVFILQLDCDLQRSNEGGKLAREHVLIQDPSKMIHELGRDQLDRLAMAVATVLAASKDSKIQSKLPYKITKQLSKGDSERKGLDKLAKDKDKDKERSTGGSGTDNSRFEQMSKYFTPGYNDSTPIEQKISRGALVRCRVISQVHKSFILAKMPCVGGGSLLLLVDQHAADERIRVEQLLNDFVNNPKNSTALRMPVPVNVDANAIPLFRQWGIMIRDGQVTHVPSIALRKCESDSEFVAKMVGEHCYDIEHGYASRLQLPNFSPWQVVTRAIPRKLLDVINSAACRNAIMFGSELSNEQCEELVYGLSKCAMPFQCCHGRPSMVPLVQL